MQSYLSKTLGILGFCSLLLAAGCSTPLNGPGFDFNPPVVEEAIRVDVEEPASSTSDSADLYFNTAEKFRDRGDYENAISTYRRALQFTPDHVQAKYGLAAALAALGEKDESTALLRGVLEALRYQPRDRKLDQIREEAESLLMQQDELAIALSEAADLLTKYGVQAEESQRDENALELYARALSLWPASGTARLRAYRLCKKNDWPYPGELVDSVAQSVFLELHELSPTEQLVKNDELRVNETKWGLPFYNQGEAYDHGLWAPAPSRLTFALDGKYARFTVKVLVSSFKGEATQMEVLEKELQKQRSGTVRFGVGGDGVTLFASDVVTYATGPVEIDVDVSGVRTLVLEANDADGSDLLDFAVWADGKLFLKR